MIPSFEELLASHSHTIHSMARELYTAKGWKLSQEELFAAGVEGLFEALQRFDPQVGTKFLTFAYPRIRGAMMDAIRQAMPMPAAVYGPLSTARHALHATTPGTPAHEEARDRLAEANAALGLISNEAVAATAGEALGVHDGLDRFSIEDEDEPAPHVDPVDDGTSRVMRLDALDPEQALQSAQRCAALHEALRQLTLEERLVVRGFYFDERGLVHEDLGHSKSWTSRIHTRALRRLRAMLEPEWGCGSATVAQREAARAPAPPTRAEEAPVLVEREVLEPASNESPALAAPPTNGEPEALRSADDVRTAA